MHCISQPCIAPGQTFLPWVKPGQPKVDLSTGAIVWKFYSTPEPFVGASVWGSMPSVDPVRNAIYIATGDNYDLPDAVTDCLKALGNLTADNVPQQIACEVRGN